jgi:hypothetical protein
VNTVMTFDRFMAGAQIGTTTDCVDGELLGSWRRLYPWDVPVTDEVPAGMICALVMRAYLAVVTPRPQGNIHASQAIRLHARPRQGESLRTVVSCAGKELRRERRFVDFATRSTGDGERRLFEADLRLIWAT